MTTRAADFLDNGLNKKKETNPENASLCETLLLVLHVTECESGIRESEGQIGYIGPSRLNRVI